MSFQVARNPRPTFVTALPVGADGQEIYYQADSSNGIIWHLRYRGTAAGGSATYPWEFVGGPAMFNGDTGYTGTDGYVSGATFLRAASGGKALPSLTVPLAGQYHVRLSSNALTLSAATDGYISFTQGASGSSSTDDGLQLRNSAATTTVVPILTSTYKVLTAAALYLEARATAGNLLYLTNVSNGRLELAITPIRVG